jgi:hypothetical protein
MENGGHTPAVILSLPVPFEICRSHENNLLKVDLQTTSVYMMLSWTQGARPVYLRMVGT